MFKFAVEKRICISKLLEEIILKIILLEEFFMNSINYLFLIVFLFCTSEYIFSQDQKSFVYSKNIGERKVVYIDIADLTEDLDDHDKVLGVLLKDENIVSGNIFFDDVRTVSVCQLVVTQNIDFNYISGILGTLGYSAIISDVGEKNDQNGRPKTLYFSDYFSFHDGFDGWKGYDWGRSNEISRTDYYDMQKQNWVSQNQSEYNAVKKKSADIIIIKKKDLEVFSEEKRNRILNNPDKYLIEE